MASVVAELDTALQTMLSLKPPGVSGTKISSITNLCVANIQSESVILQKIYTHFKKTPGTHKLGVLYVVDSVTRQWVDHARKAGQAVGSAASDGTYAAGVNRVTELLPVLMNDIIQHAPPDQKEKIKKLVDIWERGSTFPATMLSSFKQKLNAPQMALSTTPPGTPPVDISQLGQHNQQQQQQQTNMSTTVPNTSAILETLKNIAKQNTPQPGTTGPPQGNPSNVSNTQNSVSQPMPASTVNQGSAFPPAAQPVNLLPPGGSYGGQPGMMSNAAAQNMANAQPNALAALAAAIPQANGGGAGAGVGGAGDLQNQLMLIQFLMQQGIPQHQWASVIGALSGGGANLGVPGNNRNGGDAATWSQAGAQNSWSGRDDQMSRDRNDRQDSQMQSPPSRYHRDRSRSPPPSWRRDVNSPPRGGRRPSPVYGDYDGESNDRNGNRGGGYDGRGRGRGGRGYGNDYRQRSPPRRSPSPRRYPEPSAGPKWMEYDPSLGKDTIKVLSRTLFIGGVTSSEDELRSVFSRFGTVQTCIVNHEKRHAFIKMVSRHDALAAKEGMELHKPPEMQLRTRWGVGFGPRDCSDYQTGVSIIPIAKLTDADRKWMLTADFGGSGGKPIEGGMVVEEPDIEIGAGVSSKAISRRMATDQGGKSGPRSSRNGSDSGIGGGSGGGGGGGGVGGGSGRYRRSDRQDGPDRESVNAIGVPPAVPTFGFQFPTMPNGMPMFPPGMTFPGAPDASQQPPAPG
ncbi:MAG: hypothetical protein M1837_001302 [Sclerophora amabilis]|nr:MAG: hypothetical protein M1837_001302 [Sclerophora amabilis]